jgi:hypothetical protein
LFFFPWYHKTKQRKCGHFSRIMITGVAILIFTMPCK